MHSSFYFVPASNASMYFCVLDVSTVQFAATLFYKMHKTVSKLWYTHTHFSPACVGLNRMLFSVQTTFCKAAF